MNTLNNMSVNKKLMAGFGLVLLLILLEKSIRYLEYVAASSVSTAIAAFVTAAIIIGVVNALMLSRMITRSLNRIMVGANKTHNAGMGYGVLRVSGVVTTPGSPTAAEEYGEEAPVEQEKENLPEEPEGMDNEQESLEDITLTNQLTLEEEAAASNDAVPNDRLSSQEGQVADQTNRTEEQNNDQTGGKSEMEEYEARLDKLTTENEYLKTQIRDFVPLMKSLAGGDLTKRAAKTRDDELGELADAYNNTIENIQVLVDDAGTLAEAGIEGKLDVRADASKYGGDFGKIIEGVNDTLDAVIGPLNVAAEYVDRISKGDIPETITDEYKGDFNEVKNNLNVCIGALNAMTEDANMLAEAGAEGKLDVRADASKHGGDFGKIIEGVNELLDAVVGPLNVAAEYVDRISKGDIPETITDEYKGDFNEVKNNLNVCIGAINAMTADANILSEAGAEGKLDVRADASKHGGDFRKIIQGLNDTLDAMIGPLNVAAEYVDRISKGDIPETITDEYKGDFNEVKNNLNVCIGALNAMTEDAAELARAGAEGKLDVRADASKHGGDFRRIIEGVNELLDAVVGPLNVAAEYVDRISKGDIPETITDEYKGDFNEVKNNLNVCIGALNAMTEDAAELARAGAEGKLDVRADASKHGGDFRGIIEGVNELLDAVVGPLNVAAEYVDRISKGDIPETITDEYKGDFNEVKNNLNVCIGALNAMTEDANTLSEAGVEGKLDVRADASKHGGDFRKIIQGLNDTLDAIVGPLNVAAEYIDRISKGDIPETITDEYKGDFNEVKNNLNVCIGAINAMTADANMLAEAGAAGKLDTRADASKHGGDFRKIIEGVNELIDAVAVPINEVVRIVNAYAEGKLDTRVQIDAHGEFEALGETLDQFGDDLQAIVAETGRIAGKAADGDLTVKAEIELKGEYNDLVNSVDKLVGVLSDAVVDARGVGDKVLGTAQGLAAATEEMNSGMEQLAASSQQVAEGSQKLAELAQVTAKNVEDVATELDQTSVNVSKSTEKGQNAVQVSHEVQEAAQNALEGLASIQEGIARTSETVSEMNTAIEKVGEMGMVITDVAGQTNMLGLNAAIEAARAGEAGKGFAVVADAVKNLAEKVKGAASESGVAIGHIRESGENAISASATAVTEASKGGEVLHTAVDGVDKSVESMGDVNVMIQEIEKGTQHVTEIVKEIVVSMDEVASISEESASASEESSSAVQQQTSAIQELTSEAQGLTDTAQELMNNLERFTVRET